MHLRRDASVNKPKILNSTELAATWADPMLRYSNILDGLFHDFVVLCEGETDCRFYHAVFDFLLRTRWPEATPQPSVLFADVGGKDAFPRATAILTTFGVPVRVIGDFDVLNRKELLSSLCSSLGANWDEFENDWKAVSNAVQKKGAAPPSIEELLAKFKEKCGTDSKRRLDQELSKQLSEIVHYPNPWSDAKRGGKAVIPSGQESVALESLMSRLQSIGIHVVPQGEVECWIRSIGGKGMAWLTQVFAKMKDGSDLFSEELLKFFSAVMPMPPRDASSLTSSDPNRDQKAASPAQADVIRDATPIAPIRPAQLEVRLATPRALTLRTWEIRFGGQELLYGLVILAVGLAIIALIRTL